MITILFSHDHQSCALKPQKPSKERGRSRSGLPRQRFARQKAILEGNNTTNTTKQP